MDQPSPIAWCRLKRSACSAASRRRTRSEKSGPRKASNGRLASSAASSRASALAARRRQAPEVDFRQHRGSLGAGLLHQLAALDAEDAAEDVVTPEDLADGAAEGGEIERSREAEGERQVHRRRDRAALELERPLLEEARRNRRAARRGDDRRRRRQAVPVLPQDVDLRRQLAQGGMLEEADDRQLDAEGLAHPERHLGGEERMAGEGEEVVLDADRLDLQHLAPDRRQELLRGIARRRAPRRRNRPEARLEARDGPPRESGAVDLAVGGERQRGQHDDVRRHHGLRQPPAEMGAEVGRGGRRLSVAAGGTT